MLHARRIAAVTALAGALAGLSAGTAAPAAAVPQAAASAGGTTAGPAAASRAQAAAPRIQAAAPRALAELDEAGTYSIWSSLRLSPGQSAVGGWNNTPPGRSYFVDVRPVATTVTTTCQIQLTRDWRVQKWNANNTRELQVWWEVKNVGTSACATDVYLGYVS